MSDELTTDEVVVRLLMTFYQLTEAQALNALDIAKVRGIYDPDDAGEFTVVQLLDQFFLPVLSARAASEIPA